MKYNRQLLPSEAEGRAAETLAEFLLMVISHKAEKERDFKLTIVALRGSRATDR